MSEGKVFLEGPDAELAERKRKADADAEPTAPPAADGKPASRGERPAEGSPAGNRADERPAGRRPSLFRRHPIWLLVCLLAIAAAAATAYFAWLVFFHPYESTDDAFVDARSISIAAKVSGYVADVPVTDNQHVDAGTTILKIDPRDYEVALEQAKGQVESANAAIANADAQIEANEAASNEVKAQVNSTQAALQFAEDEFGRQQALVKSGAGTVESAQQARSNFLQAQASFQQSQASLASSIKNINVAKAQKANAVASLHQAEAQVQEAELNLTYTTITSEQPGRIVRLTGGKGLYIEAGQAVSMFVPDQIWVTANFKETQLSDMRPGQAVEIRIDAYPDHELTGKVDSIQPGSGTAFSLLPAENATGNYVKVTQRVPVKIVVDNWPQDLSIGPGMSVVPTVTVRPRS